MILCRVVGSIVSTIKHDSYKNTKLLIVRPITPEGVLKSGTMVAVDTVGAGEGNTVLVASEGRAAMEIMGFAARQPLRSVVVGIVDHIERGHGAS
ncbi:MAG: ethanolamine utilization protein EutN [Bacteroidetes bacterium]|jgi:microcompartment protein CcmK/EutM|nr:ethanolamine utilization protein EutN [Bacteroidota bacterium]